MAERLSFASKNSLADPTHISVNVCVCVCVCEGVFRKLRSGRLVRFSGAAALNVYIPETMKQSACLTSFLTHLESQAA